MSAIRLDKYLCLQGEMSRTEAGAAIRNGRVAVGGQVVRNPSLKFSTELAVTIDGTPVNNSEKQYYLLYKPSGILTAARDGHAATVMDLLPPAFLKKDVLPVGRLDKDTTGLLLLTNDGELAHYLLSPKRHVWKKYRAVVTGRLTEEERAIFQNGIRFKEFVSEPARMDILSSSDQESLAEVWLREGKYHQVKRMFAAVGHEVTSLHRQSFGPLELPEQMLPGEFRSLTEEELNSLRKAAYGNGSVENA